MPCVLCVYGMRRKPWQGRIFKLKLCKEDWPANCPPGSKTAPKIHCEMTIETNVPFLTKWTDSLFYALHAAYCCCLRGFLPHCTQAGLTIAAEEKGLHKQKVKGVGYTEDKVPFELVTAWTYPTGKDTLTESMAWTPVGQTLTEGKPLGLLQNILKFTLLTWPVVLSQRI